MPSKCNKKVSENYFLLELKCVSVMFLNKCTVTFFNMLKPSVPLTFVNELVSRFVSGVGLVLLLTGHLDCKLIIL